MIFPFRCFIVQTKTNYTARSCWGVIVLIWLADEGARRYRSLRPASLYRKDEALHPEKYNLISRSSC